MCVNMEEQIITIFRRDTQTIKVTITDSDGSVFNLALLLEVQQTQQLVFVNLPCL